MKIPLPNTPVIRIPRGKKWVTVYPDQIVRLEASSNYTYVHFTDQPPLLMAKVLGKYEKMLHPYGFIRIHRSHLVNRAYITRIEQSDMVRLADTFVAEISRRKRGEVLRCLALLAG